MAKNSKKTKDSETIHSLPSQEDVKKAYDYMENQLELYALFLKETGKSGSDIFSITMCVIENLKIAAICRNLTTDQWVPTIKDIASDAIAQVERLANAEKQNEQKD